MIQTFQWPNRAIGVFLLQEGKPVCFTSHTLNRKERNYAQIESVLWSCYAWISGITNYMASMEKQSIQIHQP